MRSFGIRFVVFFVILCLTVPTLGVTAANETVSLTMSCDGDAYYGGEIRIRIAVSKPASALSGLEFTLKYNPDHVSPLYTVNTEDGREMDALVEKMPEGWEQMSYHSDDDGLYHFRFAMPDNGKSLLDTAGGIVMEIPFVVLAAGSFDFVIDSADIIAIGSDANLTPMSGNGSMLTVVADSDAQKLSVKLSGSDTANENGLYYLDINVTNLGDTAGIIALQLELEYDKSVFSPTVTENESNQMDSFMTSMPQNSWEQMCTLDAKNGSYTLRFAAIHAESATNAEKLLSGESLTVTVPFKIIASEGNIGSFNVASASIIAVNGVNGVVTGNGSTKSVSIEKAPDAVIPEELGYTVEDGLLLFVPEKTNVADFMTPLKGFTLTDADGNTVTDGYVCTDYILTDGNATALSVVVRGDADGNGKVDTFDYVLVKRAYFGTYKLTDAGFRAVAISDGVTISAYDYLLIKRHYFGTIDINKM